MISSFVRGCYNFPICLEVLTTFTVLFDILMGTTVQRYNGKTWLFQYCNTTYIPFQREYCHDFYQTTSRLVQVALGNRLPTVAKGNISE